MLHLVILSYNGIHVREERPDQIYVYTANCNNFGFLFNELKQNLYIVISWQINRNRDVFLCLFVQGISAKLDIIERTPTKILTNLLCCLEKKCPWDWTVAMV